MSFGKSTFENTTFGISNFGFSDFDSEKRCGIKNKLHLKNTDKSKDSLKSTSQYLTGLHRYFVSLGIEIFEKTRFAGIVALISKLWSDQELLLYFLIAKKRLITYLASIVVILSHFIE